MKVYSQEIGNIFSKINNSEHILPILSLRFIHILAKTVMYKETKNKHILKTECPVSIKQKTILISVLSLTCWIYSNDPKITFYFRETSFQTSLTQR